jgi:hypothetical protein
MSDESALLPLKKTHESILRIKQSLVPFLMLLRRHHRRHSGGHNQNDIMQHDRSCSNQHQHNDEDDRDEKQTILVDSKQLMEPLITEDLHRIRQAEAAVALAIATLRFMAFRLQGQERGTLKNDPLRMELNKLKEMLSQVEDISTKQMGQTWNLNDHIDDNDDHHDDHDDKNDENNEKNLKNGRNHSHSKRKQKDEEEDSKVLKKMKKTAK